jgi:hypothetical protein
MRSGIEEHGSDACLAHLMAHTVAIVNSIRIEGLSRFTGEKADSEQQGTGCPIKWGERHLILSAAHVFENAELKDLRFLTFANQPLCFKDPKDIKRSDAVDALPVGDPTAEIHRCKWEDLAIVTVSPDTFPDLDYVDVAADWIDPPQGEYLHFCGFPVDHSTIIERRFIGDREDVGLALFPTAFTGKVLPSPSADDIKFKYGGDLDPAKHCLIPYELSGMSQHPGGVSGSAAWWESDEKLQIWRPNFKFAGICTHCHRDGTIVRVVRAPIVRKFLAELFGDSGDRAKS